MDSKLKPMPWQAAFRGKYLTILKGKAKPVTSFSPPYSSKAEGIGCVRLKVL